MSPEIQSALRAINRRFYDRHARGFDASRGRPWPGWQRLADRLVPPPRTVLDAGCGNGRFGAFLAGHRCAGRRFGAFRYLGVDGCGELLRAAGERLDGLIEAPDLRCLDVLDEDLDRALGGERFDLIALFGVLHHVPGADSRRALLRRLGRLLAPAGLLAASVWRFDRTRRFARRVVPWEAYNEQRTRHGAEPIATGALEAGDTLLSWGGDGEHPRYCHFPDDAEIEALAGAPGLELADRYETDGPSGRDNLYLVWRC